MSADATMREIKAVDSGSFLRFAMLIITGLLVPLLSIALSRFFLFYFFTFLGNCLLPVSENQKNLLSDGWRMNQVYISTITERYYMR